MIRNVICILGSNKSYFDKELTQSGGQTNICFLLVRSSLNQVQALV